MRPSLLGPVCAMAAMVFFSTNDVLIKILSETYALHLIFFFRSLFQLGFILIFIVPIAGGLSALKTRRLPEHLIRASFVVIANMAFFLGLAAMPIAEAVAIFFVSPLVITVFSVIFLREQVGPRRWAAVALGFIGVLVMMRPGTEAFKFAALLPLVAATAYAGLNIMTRKLGDTEGPTALAFYIPVMFLAATLTSGLLIGDGRFDTSADPSAAFFFRAWSWPAGQDWWWLLVVGVGVALGGWLISQAYRLGEAAQIAPFEYVALPMSIFWSVTVFGQVPDALSFVGMALILGAGLFTVFRKTRTDGIMAEKGPAYRR